MSNFKSIRFFSIQLAALLLVGFSTVSCSEENFDSVQEISCSQAHGLWTVRSATCDGVTVEDVTPVTFLFDRETDIVTQSAGRVDCSTQFNWLVEIGEQSAIFSMTGEGSLTCTESGVDVSFCASNVNSCNSAIDITGLKNEFPTCVIRGEQMSLIRTVSAVNNPDNLSYCEDGQEEQVQMVQGEYIPTDPDSDPDFDPDIEQGFLEIAGTNPADFGTHPIGFRETMTLEMTNTGTGLASGIAVSGLGDPFLFLGGEYPGTGGSCGVTLAQGETCTMVVEFFSNVGGYFTDNLLIQYNNGRTGGLINLGLAATSSASLALIKISDGPFYDFGNVIPNESATKTFVLTNTGGGDAMGLSVDGLDAPFDFSGGSYPGLNGDCGVTLSAGQSCEIEIEFSPLEEEAYNDIIVAPYFDGVNSQQADRNIFGVSSN